MPPGAPDPSDGAVLERLRTALHANGYRPTSVEHFLTENAVAAYSSGWYAPVRRRTNSVDALSTLSRLFALGFDVPAADLDEVRGAGLRDWVHAGLVAVRRNTAHPVVSIQSLKFGQTETYLVSDVQPPGTGRPPFADFVMAAGGSSYDLAALTPRTKCERALDIGTGNGIQAILASRHCERVVATDISPRALAFAKFNLAWNGVENVELRLGDRYEPVSGEEFDLIVCNPPFVVSPATTILFRDSALPSDTISETLVRGAAEHLAPGGWSQIMCQWVHYDGERWQDRVQDWVADTGCNAWAVQRLTVDSIVHATEWLLELGRADAKEADQQFDAWMRYFDREGIVGIGNGFVALRRTTDSLPWYVTAELGDPLGDATGEAVASFFETQDWLRANQGAGAVLDTRWRMAEHVRLDTSQGVTGQRGAANRYVLRQRAGMRTSAEITKVLAEIVPNCDGTRPLRAIVGEHLQGRWRDPARHEADIEAVFRQLVAPGFMVRVPESR